jgi:hypothetical protein
MEIFSSALLADENTSSASLADKNHCRIFVGSESTKILECVHYFRRPPGRRKYWDPAKKQSHIIANAIIHKQLLNISISRIMKYIITQSSNTSNKYNHEIHSLNDIYKSTKRENTNQVGVILCPLQ